MKLFLASHNFGEYVSILQEMVGDNRKTLLIANASDYNSDTERQARVAEKLELFRQNGFDAQELDLREYFSTPPEKLEDYAAHYDLGLVFCIGGDMFLLATALSISGIDKIIRDRLEVDNMVYGGSSAGACVTASELEIYERDEMRIEEIPVYYGVEAVATGLNLISEYIIPHIDVAEFREQYKFYMNQPAKIHAEVIELRNSDVYIVNDYSHELKRGHLS